MNGSVPVIGAGGLVLLVAVAGRRAGVLTWSGVGTLVVLAVVVATMIAAWQMTGMPL